jgi:hypothetical protein
MSGPDSRDNAQSSERGATENGATRPESGEITTQPFIKYTVCIKAARCVKPYGAGIYSCVREKNAGTQSVPRSDVYLSS